MDHVTFFKLQAKNLHRDFKTRTKKFDELINVEIYEFSPRFFDVDEIVVSYDLSDEEIEKLSLMKAQHFIAQFVGFFKWNSLISASADELELAKLIFDKQHIISHEEWSDYICEAESTNRTTFDTKARIAIFKEIFKEEGDFAFMPHDIRLKKSIPKSSNIKELNTTKQDEQLISLPLVGEIREEFIKSANEVFETVLVRVGAHFPEKVRARWNAEEYIDEELLQPSMLPISKDYALSLIDAFLVQHVISICEEFDK